MKHGIAFRKLSRTTSHRLLLLRNLVTSLFEHQQIKTTLPKAREAARLAEKVITAGKKGGLKAHEKAAAVLLNPTAITNLFNVFTQRYAERPGGYTRIHKFGNRPGDNAPHAILELVDNPRDLRWEITSRAIGRELLKNQLNSAKSGDLTGTAPERVASVLETEQALGVESKGILRPKTRLNLQKILRYRTPGATKELSQKAAEYADELLANPIVHQSIFEETKAKNPHTFPPRRLAGHRLLGEDRPALSIAKGSLAPEAVTPPPSKRKLPVFSFENALTKLH